MPPRTQFLATEQCKRLAANPTINADAALQPASTWTSVFLWSVKTSSHNTSISQHTTQSYLALLPGIAHFKAISLSRKNPTTG